MSGGRYPSNRDEQSYRREIEDLKRRISNLETGRRAVATQVGSGEISVKGGVLRAFNGSGQQIFAVGPYKYIFGPHEFYDPDQTVIAMWRGNGSEFFSMVGVNESEQWFSFRDQLGNQVIADDIEKSQGLARPYIPLATYPFNDWFGAPPSTTSGTMVPLHTAHFRKQQPAAEALAYVTTPAGTTGEIDLWDGSANAVIDGPFTIASGANAYQYLAGDVVGDHLDFGKVELRARRTGGAGAVGVGVGYITGIQSA
jgi:hypothetical protein